MILRQFSFCKKYAPIIYIYIYKTKEYIYLKLHQLSRDSCPQFLDEEIKFMKRVRDRMSLNPDVSDSKTFKLNLELSRHSDE
jgi:hypothetical protein